jgi:hypothetical protein
MSGQDTDIRNAISTWAEADPRIRRVWILSGGTQEARPPESGIDIALELEPVGDSEETLAVWMANSEKWRAQLQQANGLDVRLEWLDSDGTAPGVRDELRMGADLLFERAA